MKAKTVSPEPCLFNQLDATPKCSGPVPSANRKFMSHLIIFQILYSYLSMPLVSAFLLTLVI